MQRPFSTRIPDQNRRVLEALRRRSMTTIQLRSELDVFSPPCRIYDLRHKQGCEIHTDMVVAETQPNHKHCIAKYSLIREVQK